MTQDQNIYRELLLEELSYPKHKGMLSPADKIHDETNASCGDQVTVYLKLDDQQKNVTNIKWSGHGCAISQGTMSLLAQKVLEIGNVQQILQLGEKDLLALLGLDAISPGRKKCLQLGLKAVHQALA